MATTAAPASSRVRVCTEIPLNSIIPRLPCRSYRLGAEQGEHAIVSVYDFTGEDGSRLRGTVVYPRHGHGVDGGFVTISLAGSIVVNIILESSVDRFVLDLT